jgi:hypothetical protein
MSSTLATWGRLAVHHQAVAGQRQLPVAIVHHHLQLVPRALDSLELQQKVFQDSNWGARKVRALENFLLGQHRV